MPTYNAAAVSDAAVAFRKPITLQFGRGTRDNLLATAEGSTDAPYMQSHWHPYDGVYVGDGQTGEIWSLAADGSVATIETPDFVDGYEYQLRLDGPATSGAVRINLYRETSAGYAGVLAPTVGGDNHCDFEILRPREIAYRHYVLSFGKGGGGVNNVDDFSGGPYIQEARVNHGVAQAILRAQLSLTAGSFNAGAVYMYKRLSYA